MKLVHCTECRDLYLLWKESRNCLCGKTSGRYLDRRNAVFSGATAVPICIDNQQFADAIRIDGFRFDGWECECATFRREEAS